MKEYEILKGLVASEGKVKGVAIKINEGFEGFPEVKNKIVILKTASTDLADKVTEAAGILSETGGFLCHLAIVCREFNIPLVVGIDNLFETIEEGDFLEIDTSKKEVYNHGKKENVEYSAES